MAGTETYNSTNLEKYIKQLENNCDNIIKAIREIDTEVDRVLQNQTKDAGLNSALGGKLLNAWQNNNGNFNNFESLFEKWVGTLNTISGINSELASSTAAVYTK